MKTIFTLAFAISFTAILAAPIKYVKRFKDEDPTQKKVFVEFDFAKSKVLNPEVINILNGKEIKRIRYIYSRYKRSDSFTQTGLDAKRFAAVKAIDSEINWDKAFYVEQTACQEASCAKNLFHGFEIIYKNEELFSVDNLHTQLYSIKAEEGGEFVTESGSIVIIPANAFQDSKGNLVTGKVEFMMREAVDPLNITMAGLETKTAGGVALESGGMFDMRARSDGKNLELASGKSIQISIPTDEVLPGMQLYSGTQNPGNPLWHDEPEDLLVKKEIEAPKKSSLTSETDLLFVSHQTSKNNNGKDEVTHLEVRRGKEVAILTDLKSSRKNTFDYMYFNEQELKNIKVFFKSQVWLGKKDKTHNPDKLTAEGSKSIVSQNYYTAKVKALCWCNVDRMMQQYGGEELKFCAFNGNKKVKDIEYQIIIPESKIAVKADRKKGKFYFNFGNKKPISILPPNKVAYVIAEQHVNDDEINFGIQKVLIKDLEEVQVGLRPMNKEGATFMVRKMIGSWAAS